MSYRILYDDELLFDPYTENEFVSEAKMTSSVSSGVCLEYLDLTISSTHRLASVIKNKKGIVRLYHDTQLLFEGYIEEIGEDLYGTREIGCASVITYLSDSVVRPYSTVAGEELLTAPSSIDGYVQWIVDQHNTRTLDSQKQFEVGVNQGAYLKESNYFYRESTQLPTTLEELSNKVLESLGGYLFLSYSSDIKILNLYADAHETNTQILDFGENITDFRKTESTVDQYTAIRPQGGTPEKAPDAQEDPKPITIEPLGNGVTSYDSDMVKYDDVVYSASAVARYGYKELAWSDTDILDPSNLLKSGIVALRKVLHPKTTLEIKAVDLAVYMGNKYKHLKTGEVARVRARARAVDEYLMVNSITLNLQKPDDTLFELGASYDTLTGSQSAYIKSLNSSINSQLDAVKGIDQTAKDAAKDAEEAKDAAGKAVTKTDLEFYQSTSSSELIGGAWEYSNLWENGKYTWERSKVFYGDGATAYTPSETGVCVSGNTGDTGRGVSKIDTTYQLGANATTPPTGTWSSTPMAATDALPYLWTKNVVTYTTGTPTTNTFYSVSTKGTVGAKGDPGDDGLTPYLHIAYANSADGSSGFSTTDSVDKLYIGTYSDYTEADPITPSLYSWTKTKGEQGDTGDPGQDGKLLFGTSTTASSTVAKVVNGVTGFTLANGVSVAVTFTNANLAAAPTLNVDGSGAKPIILYGGTNIFWEANGTVVFIYNGTSWVCNSTPVYASESTIGDPANSNVHIGKDSSGESTIDFRQAATIVAQMQANKISLGMNSAQSVIDFCQAAGEIGVLDSFLTFFGDLIAIRGEDSVVVASTDNAAVAAGNTTSTRRSSFIADTFINQTDFGSTAQMESYLKEISDPTKNKQALVTTTANNSVPAEVRLDALFKKNANTGAKTASVQVFAQESGTGVNLSGDEINISGTLPIASTNSGIKINDKNLADFVVEKGKGSNADKWGNPWSWHWRKWSSGQVELWGEGILNPNYNLQHGSLWYGGNEMCYYPFNVGPRWYVLATVTGGNGLNGVSIKDDTSTQTGFNLWDGLQGRRTIYLKVYVVGFTS